MRKIKSQKNRLKTQPLALSKRLVFSERPLSHQHVVRSQLIRKQKYQSKWMS